MERRIEIDKVDNGFVINMVARDGKYSTAVVMKEAHVMKAVKAWLGIEANLKEAKVAMAAKVREKDVQQQLRIG